MVLKLKMWLMIERFRLLSRSRSIIYRSMRRIDGRERDGNGFAGEKAGRAHHTASRWTVIGDNSRLKQPYELILRRKVDSKRAAKKQKIATHTVPFLSVLLLHRAEATSSGLEGESTELSKVDSSSQEEEESTVYFQSQYRSGAAHRGCSKNAPTASSFSRRISFAIPKVCSTELARSVTH